MATGAAKLAGSVSIAIQANLKLVEAVGLELNELESNIDQILREARPDTTDRPDEKAQEPPCDLTKTIEAINEKLAVIQNRLRDIRTRVEL